MVYILVNALAIVTATLAGLAAGLTYYAIFDRAGATRHTVKRARACKLTLAAFAAMWRAIPLLLPIGIIARNRLVLYGLEWGYRMFLGIRPLLQMLAGQRVAS